MSTFAARFDGRCAADCGARIAAGDLVEYVDDDLAHAECRPRVDALVVVGSVCLECFTERSRSGVCGCE